MFKTQVICEFVNILLMECLFSTKFILELTLLAMSMLQHQPFHWVNRNVFKS